MNRGSAVKMNLDKRDPSPIENQKDYQELCSLDKRRRSGAENYIKKRFLYDVVEPPKRTRQKKLTNLAETAGFLSGLPSSKSKLKYSQNCITDEADLLVYLRSRRGRRLKPKLEYSPSYVANDALDEPSLIHETDDRINHKMKTHHKKSKNKLDLSSNWSKNNVSKAKFGFSNSANDKSFIDEIIKNDVSYFCLLCFLLYIVYIPSYNWDNENLRSYLLNCLFIIYYIVRLVVIVI